MDDPKGIFRFDGEIGERDIERLISRLRENELVTVKMLSCRGVLKKDFLREYTEVLTQFRFHTLGCHLSGIAIPLFLLGSKRQIYPSAKFAFSDFPVELTPTEIVPLHIAEKLLREPLLHLYSGEQIEMMGRIVSRRRQERTTLIDFLEAKTGQRRPYLLRLHEKKKTLGQQQIIDRGFAHELYYA